jgi:hypothetical protein
MSSTSGTATTAEHPLLDRDAPTLLEPSSSSRPRSNSIHNLDWRQALGGSLVVVGALLLILGWYGVSGTTDSAEQLSYFISGGLGGAACLAAGLALLISFEHVADRQTLARLGERLDALEFGLSAEFDALREATGAPRVTGPANGRWAE